VLAAGAADLMEGFLSTDREHMGSRQDGPMILTVDVSSNAYPHGWTIPSIKKMVRGNGVAFVDYNYLEHMMEELGPELKHIKTSEFDPIKSIGFYRDQQVDETTVAIQPDTNCMAWMIARGMHTLDGAKVKIVKSAGDPWKDDMAKALDEEGPDVTDVTESVKMTFKNHGRNP
jgi:hypothetical protein